MTALKVAMTVSLCLPRPVAVSNFVICRGLCACTEMLWICVLYVSFGSKVRPLHRKSSNDRVKEKRKNNIQRMAGIPDNEK